MTVPTMFSLWLSLALVVPGVIIGSAFADMARPPVPGQSRSLNGALAIARESTPWRLHVKVPVLRVADENEKWVIALLVVGVVFVVAKYSQYVSEITSGLVVFSFVVFLASIFAFVVFWVKKCVDGRSVVWRMLLSSILWTTGLFNSYWLQHAPLHGDAVGAVRSAVNAHGPIGALFHLPGGEFQQVVNQMIGAMLCLMMLVVFIALCLASISGVNIAAQGRPRWFWLVLFWLNKWATLLRVWVFAVIMGLVALALTSGAVFDWFDALTRVAASLSTSAALTI